ncbi:MAG: acyl-CoA thioesterase [Hyphomicrobiales bacterium]|nr:acyl-CoA thioesterase [Hyphomicrobiales bacterium]
MSCWAGVRFAGATFALAAVVLCAPAMAQDAGQCSAPLEARGLEHAPVHFRERIAQGKPLKIVAIGSSSTSGAGASSRAATYPARLEAELKAQLPGLPITVLNKGVGGEEAPQMVARFEADVLEEAPDLVLWQVGSNSVLRDHPTPATLIHQGIEQLKANGADVILVNPQYAPRIIAKLGAEHAVDVITATARDEEVGLFDRFAVMRYWRETENLPFEQFITPDGLHMNDWGYACVAKLLAGAILDSTKLPAATAAVPVATAAATLKR